MASTEIAPLTSSQQELIDVLGIEFSDTSDLAQKIGLRLAMAQTPEELFAEDGAAGWEAKEGVPFRVRRIYWLRSSFAEGAGIYAVVEAAHAETGEATVLTTGATNVLVQLARAEQMGWLETPLILRKNPSPTSNGYYPHKLYQA